MSSGKPRPKQRRRTVMRDKPAAVLFTNLSYVAIDPVRTNSSALLLELATSFVPGTVRYRARGFGPDSAWPVFDLEIPSMEYTLTDPQGLHRVIGDGTDKPLFSCAMLRIKKGPNLLLTIEDHEQPIDIRVFYTEDYAPIWATLKDRVARYWRAPYMPYLKYGPSKAPHKETVK